MAVTANADDGSEEVVELADCPKAVQKTLKRESKGGTIVEIERETEDGETIYEAEVEIDGKQYEVEITADGTLLSNELEEEDERLDTEVSIAKKRAMLRELDARAGVGSWKTFSSDGTKKGIDFKRVWHWLKTH